MKSFILSTIIAVLAGLAIYSGLSVVAYSIKDATCDAMAKATHYNYEYAQAHGCIRR